MIRTELEKIIAGNNLSFAEAHQLMLNVMCGEVNNSQIAALLIALRIKGEDPAEVAGFAQAMRDKSIKLTLDTENLIDVCGTGGDDSGSFNISTTAAFVIAGAGINVAKHGNRSISSKSGSADVLTALGVNISLPAEESIRAINETGISFLFAPDYHPAMKFVAPVRKELAMKTVFNILGPLTNPAGTKKQVIGTFNNHTAGLMARAAAELKMERVCFVCTDNRYDEVMLSGKTTLLEYARDEELKKKTLTHLDFDLPEINIRQLKGDTPVQNAEILTRVLSGKEKGAARHVTIANAAIGLYTAGHATDLKICVDEAIRSIDSGRAMEKLDTLRKYGN